MIYRQYDMNKQQIGCTPPIDRLPVIKCRCGAFIDILNIEKWNGCNEEGEEYGVVTATCKNCETEFESSQWGELARSL